MKLYISKKTGSMYWVDKEDNFCFVPMPRYDDLIDLEEDGAVVDYENLAVETLLNSDESLVDFLKKIETELKS